jgi:hypothetical protein
MGLSTRRLSRMALPAAISSRLGSSAKSLQKARFNAQFFDCLRPAAWLVVLALMASGAKAQVNVVTAHNDIARTGQNLNETILTPSNVNPAEFGLLFTQQVNSPLQAQPLYVSQVPIPGKGTHNVIYVATYYDWVYAYDADSNGGANAAPLWSRWLQPAGGSELQGVVGTPVIDLPSQTMYVVSSDEIVGTASTSHDLRLHALDITTGADKLGGPVLIQASVPSNSTGSSGGVLTLDGSVQQQRAGLLLLHGVLYIAFGSIGDIGAWHGWLLSYNAATLQQIDIFCTTPYGTGGGSGIWMGGAGLAAEVNDPTKPYGRMFVSTGNGDFGIFPPTVNGQPYSNPLNMYGDNVVDFDLTNGIITPQDMFTPHNQATLEAQDGDLGSGGPVLLPAQTLASGATLNPVLEIGKSGMFYVMDRNNLGGYHGDVYDGKTLVSVGYDDIVQEVQTPIVAGLNWGAGVWGSEAYWNNNIYSPGTNQAKGGQEFSGTGHLAAYSFVNGVLSSAPTSQSTEQFVFSGPTPSVSANGATNAIVWVIDANGNSTAGPPVLLAYDATNLAKTLYSSNTNPARDTAVGKAAKFTVPTIANGKVYVGANGGFSVYGLLNSEQTAPAPVISPGSATVAGEQSFTITDSLPGATIYYTRDGSTPTANSMLFYGQPVRLYSTTTISAIASATGYLPSAPVSATYTFTSATANPAFSLAGGTYSGTKNLQITDSSANAIIYYTLDGSTPTTASAIYTQPIALPVYVTETVNALAIAPGLTPSTIVSANYTIQTAYAIDFTQGFALAHGPMQFNGSTDLDDIRLQLTDGGLYEAGSAFYTTPVNIQSFTTDFIFQLSNPAADGSTFTIQNAGPSALGGGGGGLGYFTIPNSLCIKFDLYNNSGEGPNSTGLFTGGNDPHTPAPDLTPSGVNLHSGDTMDAHVTYDGTDLNLTLTDTLTLATFSTSFPINIPATVGGNTAYVGFTAGTGGASSSQKFTYWTYVAGAPPLPSYPAGFDTAGLTLNGGAALSGTRLRLTDGQAPETRSAFYSSPVDIQQFTTSFDFQLTNAAGDGFTFAIQGAGPTAIGGSGGGLGYFAIGAKSLAIKFDLYNNQGEGPDSTDLYEKGAAPKLPSIDLTGSGINLHSGDTFNAKLTYDGTTLTVVITDTVTNASATQTYTVNIPSLVGGATAYVGFTGASGGATAIQDILNWTYSVPAATAAVTE